MHALTSLCGRVWVRMRVRVRAHACACFERGEVANVIGVGDQEDGGDGGGCPGWLSVSYLMQLIINAPPCDVLVEEMILVEHGFHRFDV